MEQRKPLRRHAAIACALTVALTTGTAGPAQAASNVDALKREATDLIARIDETTRNYQEASAELDELDAIIAENEAKSAEIEAQMPEQRARTAASIKNQYRFQQNSTGLLDLILSSEDFASFISALHYIDTINQRNAYEIHALNELQDALVQTQSSLKAERDALVAKTEEARNALEGARDTRTQIQNWINAAANDTEKADRVQAVAQAVQEIEASNANKGNNESANNTNNNNSDATTQQASTPAPANTNTNDTPKPSDNSNQSATSAVVASIVEENTTPTPAPTTTEPATSTNTTSSDGTDWAARINTYLEGTALAGHGADFAQAAETYGVDPRIAPAISGVESGWGQVCFKDHNAWGWGSQSWDSWESAIDNYVKGYSDIYGSGITLEGAEMYASNDIYDVWYETVLSEMDRI